MPLTDTSFAAVAEQLAVPLALVTPDSRLVGANASGYAAMGLSADADGELLTDLLAGPAAEFLDYLRRCARTFSPLPGLLHLNNEVEGRKRLTITGARTRHETGGDGQPSVLLQMESAESTERHKRFVALNDAVRELEEQIYARKRTESLLAAQKDSLSRVVAGDPLNRVLAMLALAVEDISDDAMVSVMLLDEDNRLRSAAAPNLPADLVRAVDGLEIGPEVGSCGTAAYTGRTVVVADVLVDPLWRNFRELAKAHDVRACWSAPILDSKDEVLGSLAMYFKTVRRPAMTDLTLIENIAHIAGLAVERHSYEQELAALLASEKRDRERAEAESRAKDQFLAMLSHELRNPLGAISNASYALEALGGTGAEHGELHRILIKEATMLNRLLDDLLDLSRLSNGKLSLRLERVPALEMIDDLRRIARTTYPKRALRTELDGDLGYVEGDRTRILQVLQNLVDNAFKYSDPDQPVALIAAADANQLTVRVRDRGCGIEADLMASIFDPFMQADHSLDRSGSGLGLGLALARRLARMHGGDVEAHSDGAGKGSEFVLRLPLAEAPEETVEVTPADRNVAMGGQRVLVVEDNASARQGLCMLLKLKGFAVDEAADGEQALERIRAQRPDVALVDIGLPVLDGYQLAECVAKEFPEAGIRLIALTGYGQEGDRRRTTEAGFAAHLVKPVELDELLDALSVSSDSPAPGYGT